MNNYGVLKGKAISFTRDSDESPPWHTDETDATPISDAPKVPDIAIPATGPVASWKVLADNSPYRTARIIAAMVNPVGDDPGGEFVTLLNTSEEKINIQGWQIIDKNNNSDILNGTIEPGMTISCTLSGKGAQLSNKGGTITLLNLQVLKVDGVAYTKTRAGYSGRPVVFV